MFFVLGTSPLALLFLHLFLLVSGRLSGVRWTRKQLTIGILSAVFPLVSLGTMMLIPVQLLMQLGLSLIIGLALVSSMIAGASAGILLFNFSSWLESSLHLHLSPLRRAMTFALVYGILLSLRALGSAVAIDGSGSPTVFGSVLQWTTYAGLFVPALAAFKLRGKSLLYASLGVALSILLGLCFYFIASELPDSRRAQRFLAFVCDLAFVGIIALIWARLLDFSNAGQAASHDSM